MEMSDTVKNKKRHCFRVRNTTEREAYSQRLGIPHRNVPKKEVSKMQTSKKVHGTNVCLDEIH